MDEVHRRRLHEEIANATVKIRLGKDKVFKGTGFFISPEGYVLTAYHCIREYPPEIWVETRFHEEYLAQLEETKTLKAERYDIAVLRVFGYQPSHCLPLGFVSRENISDEVVGIGYPENQYRLNEGKISGVEEIAIASEVIKGEGQSGGSIYHYRSQRVVGLASTIWKREVIVNEGLAVRFEALFTKWSELREINQRVAVEWDKRLQRLNRGQPMIEEKPVVKSVPPQLKTPLWKKVVLMVWLGLWAVFVISPLTEPSKTPAVEEKSKPLEKKLPTVEEKSEPPAEVETAFQDKLKDGGLGPEMVNIPGGSFMMGNDGNSDEKPVHEVKVSGFAMGKYEITRGQFRQFVEASGYETEAEKGENCWGWTGSAWEQKTEFNWRDVGFPQEETHPVVCVSWNDAVAYAEWLSNQTGKTYRLPTEAEWEYATRAGSQSKWYFGDNESQLGNYAWYGENSGGKTHPVGQKQPNAFGLYDMMGNAWEWTCSEYENHYNGKEQECIGKNRAKNNMSLRGGVVCFNAGNCWVANRPYYSPSSRFNNVGFRVVMVPP